MSSQLVKNISLGIIALLVFFALLWVVTGLTGKESSFHAAIEIFSNYPAWEIALIGSLLLAFVIFLMLRAPAHYLNSYWYSLTAGTLMMGAAWFFRWIILMSIQGIPKYGAGLYLYSFPWGSDGFLGIVGVFGLCFAVLAIVTWFLEQYPAKQSLNLS